MEDEISGSIEYEVNTYNPPAVVNTDRMLGVQTVLKNKIVYIVTREVDNEAVVDGVSAIATVTVNQAGTYEKTGTQTVIYDFSQYCIRE